MNREKCIKFGQALLANDISQCQDMLAEEKGQWLAYGQRLLDYVQDTSSKPAFTVIARGNSKLGRQIYSFSTLALLTCPGKGECQDYCYSLKAWRYPAAFYRQCQNSWLMKYVRRVVTEAFEDLPDKATLRLYVDGDFRALSDVEYWMTTLECRPDIKAYGYSKSWNELLAFDAIGEWPENYSLNLSSGSCHSAKTFSEMLKLPCVRGTFFTLPKDTALSKNAFRCPGSCQSCNPKQGGPACANKAFTRQIEIHKH